MQTKKLVAFDMSGVYQAFGGTRKEESRDAILDQARELLDGDPKGVMPLAIVSAEFTNEGEFLRVLNIDFQLKRVGDRYVPVSGTPAEIKTADEVIKLYSDYVEEARKTVHVRAMSVYRDLAPDQKLESSLMLAASPDMNYRKSAQTEINGFAVDVLRKRPDRQ